ncbi:13378_t:CDS:2 [Entrophospora sp. SA101]|nr:13378_t:CDS:2 [Entrophospora sp. SA101]
MKEILSTFLPSVEEIVEGIESKFTKRFIDPNQVGGTVGDTVENGVDKAKEFGSNAGDTVSNTAGDVINKINELSPTMLDIIALLFLSTFFVALSLTFDMLLFVWVFKAVALIPGLGQQKTGSGIHLAAWSLIFLTVATILMMIGVCNKMCISGIVKKLRRNKLSPSDEKNQTLTKITYVQGMNVLAAPFLFVMPELDAFYSFSAFIQHFCPLYVTPNLEGLLDKCLEIIDSNLFIYLKSKNLTAEIYAFPSVLTFCACTPPLDQVLKLWDFLFAYGVHLNILYSINALRLLLLFGG